MKSKRFGSNAPGGSKRLGSMKKSGAKRIGTGNSKCCSAHSYFKGANESRYSK